MVTENRLLMQDAKIALRGRWSDAVITTIIYALISCAVSAILGWIPFAGILSLVVVAPLAVGFSKYFLNFNRELENDYNTLFYFFSRNGYGRVLGTVALMYVYIFLWTLLLIVPGIIKSYAYSMTYYILSDDETVTPQDALRRSEFLMRGYKMKLFLLQLRFIGWFLLACLTLGIGFLWLIPYMEVAYVKFYEDIKREKTQGGDTLCNMM